MPTTMDEFSFGVLFVAFLPCCPCTFYLTYMILKGRTGVTPEIGWLIPLAFVIFYSIWLARDEKRFRKIK